jgi:hypothetical protein
MATVLPPMLRRAGLIALWQRWQSGTVLDFLKTRLRLAQVSFQICQRGEMFNLSKM